MKITFTGSHGTGKTTAAKILRKVINETYPGLAIAPLGSVTRSVLGWVKGMVSYHFLQKVIHSKLLVFMNAAVRCLLRVH